MSSILEASAEYTLFFIYLATLAAFLTTCACSIKEDSKRAVVDEHLKRAAAADKLAQNCAVNAANDAEVINSALYALHLGSHPASGGPHPSLPRGAFGQPFTTGL